MIIWVVWVAASDRTFVAFAAFVAFEAYLRDYFPASCLVEASFLVVASLESCWADSYLEFVEDSVIFA